MGETGPCGPCSEIFYDHGENYIGKPPSEADETGDRFVEIWNLVFMQYEQVDSENRIDLPRPSIDTGMGIERIAAVMQGTNDNYQVDSILEIINHSKELTKNDNENLISSHRVIADHLRSSCFLIADGVLPSNEGRGYVLRRIMRRAMRHVHILNYNDLLMHKLAPTLISNMKMSYPELERAQVLAAIASLIIILIGFLFRQFEPLAGEKAALKGENKFLFDRNMPDDVIDELAWGSEAILTSTAAASILIHNDGVNILRRGITSSNDFKPGETCLRSIKDMKLISLANTKFYPGRDEFIIFVPKFHLS